MPDFFLISGLFLARVIDRDWRDLSRPQGRALRLFLCAVGDDPVRLQGADVRRRAGLARRRLGLYLEAFIEPFGTLWFIYLLPIFFVVIKLTRGVPLAVDLARSRAALEIAHIDTGWTVIDEFASRFVYFYTGYIFAPHVFALAAGVQRAAAPAHRSGSSLWALRQRRCWCSPAIADLPFVSLGLGLVGACAVVSIAALLAQERRVPAAALLRAQLDRHLSRLLPADGGDPHRAAQDRHHHRPRHDLACWSRPPASIGALCWFWAARGTPLRLPVRAAGLGAARSPRGSRCSRRNDSQRARARIDSGGWRPTFGPCQHPRKPKSAAKAAPQRRRNRRVRSRPATTSSWSTARATSSAPTTRCRR